MKGYPMNIKISNYHNGRARYFHSTFCLVVGARVGAVGGGPGSTQRGAPLSTWCECRPCSRR